MRRLPFLSWLLVALALSTGCTGDNPDAMFPPEDTGAMSDALDIQRPDLDVPPLDTGPRQDTGGTQDTGPRQDTGSAVDTGMGGGGVCPTGCATHTDCDPCWRPGETRVGQYCCLSGACIYRGAGMTCEDTTPDGGTGGADGFSFDGFSFDGFSFDLPPFSFDGFSFDLPGFSLDGFDFDAGTP